MNETFFFAKRSVFFRAPFYSYPRNSTEPRRATCNVGANSPEEYGDYYAWGETETKSTYTLANYEFRTSGDYYDNVMFNKYNKKRARGTVDKRKVLEMSDDVAHQKWGGSWRMPTEKEFKELIDNCFWTWT